mmetsp:Transcript_47433/g.93539  ORF Transcript_47433/g.93539 Transcript_47433/m.93539 type:complete len:88 (+) Transcript_47433:760-1023(+)
MVICTNKWIESFLTRFMPGMSVPGGLIPSMPLCCFSKGLHVPSIFFYSNRPIQSQRQQGRNEARKKRALTRKGTTNDDATRKESAWF